MQILSLLMMAITAVVLIGLQQKLIGWGLFIFSVFLTTFGLKTGFKKHILLVYVSLGVLGFIPITTDITNENFIRMGLALSAAIAFPCFVARRIYKDNLVRFSFHHGRAWFRSEFGYIALTAGLAYLIIPFYLENSGAYINWGVENTTASITRLFIGTNALGIWDELFFVSTVLGILRRYMPFIWANALQAVLFTSFLFELGFTGWGPLLIFPFALLQGFVFRKTDSLFYVITIHLTLDFILFLALLNAHHPELANIFIT